MYIWSPYQIESEYNKLGQVFEQIFVIVLSEYSGLKFKYDVELESIFNDGNTLSTKHT